MNLAKEDRQRATDDDDLPENNAELESYKKDFEERIKPQLDQMEAMKDKKKTSDHIQYHDMLKNQIDSYLESKNQHLAYVQARLQGGSLSNTLDREIKDVFKTPKLEQ